MSTLQSIPQPAVMTFHVLAKNPMVFVDQI